MIKLKSEDLEGYQVFLTNYLKAQRRGSLERRLPGILETFLEQSRSAHLLFPGLSQNQIKSIEYNAKDTIDILFDGVYTPWIHLSFSNRYQDLVVRGGPAIRAYELDDDHVCSPERWKHTFKPHEELEMMLVLGDKTYWARETFVKPYHFFEQSGTNPIIRPVLFPTSSATQGVYDTKPDFEVREETLPVTLLELVLKFIRENPDISSLQKRRYSELIDTSEINPEDYQGQRTFKVELG